MTGVQTCALPISGIAVTKSGRVYDGATRALRQTTAGGEERILAERNRRDELTQSVTQAQQADYLTRAYRLLEQHPYVQLAYWYNLRNNFWDQDADTWETQLGLMRTDFTHKPSYDAFKSYQPGAPASPPLTAPSHTPATSKIKTRRVTRTSIALRHRRLAVGRVRGADGGRLTITLQRRGRRGHWTAPDARGLSLAAGGAFRIKLRFGRARVLLLRAVYEGSATAAPSRSRALRVRR